MKDLIAYCGLDCEKCDARRASLTDDNALREKTAKLWSQLNGVEITPEMINCVGCRVDGVKSPYCDFLCPIRRCAMERECATCADCPTLAGCTTVGAVLENNEEAARNLGIGK